MSVISEARTIARYLTTSTSSKKHGGYLIYEDDKIKIVLDTYVPNTDIYVKDGEHQIKVCTYNGAHGYNQEYHSGAWEEYVTSIYPLALEAQQKKEAEDDAREEARRRRLTDPADDAHIFS